MTSPWPLSIGLLCAALAGCVTADTPPSATATLVQTESTARQETVVEAGVDAELAQEGNPTQVLIDAAVESLPVATEPAETPPPEPPLPAEGRRLLQIEQAMQTGQVENPELNEISGLAVSRRTPGVLFALNDSGNPPVLYAMGESGSHLGQWRINARNRDWEDMGSVQLAGKDYLVLGDTGDNLQVHRESALYLLEEPSLDTPATTVLDPYRTLRFTYEDGPHNVEAFAISGGTVYLISKEPVAAAGARASRLYTLSIPEEDTDALLIARFAGQMPQPVADLEARLAAAVAGVDLNHPTALDFDETTRSAYLLTYRHVLRIVRKEDQTWTDALTSSAKRIHAHTLRQAEALTVAAGRAVWLTSENVAAPLWALPVVPPS